MVARPLLTYWLGSVLLWPPLGTVEAGRPEPRGPRRLWDEKLRGVLAVGDTIKPSAAAAVHALRRLGLRPVLLTGDNRATARAVAAAVGIDEVIAGILPAAKAAAVRDLQARGHRVAMVGDGVNDGPALAAADLGMAVSATAPTWRSSRPT